MSTPLPAHRTKHLQTLNYPVPNTPHILTLTQTQSPCSASTGTTLWLSSQLLTYHLLAPFPRPHRPRGRAIGLGAGTGLTSHILSYLGFRVCATDLAQIVSTILSNNGGSERKLAGLYRRTLCIASARCVQGRGGKGSKKFPLVLVAVEVRYRGLLQFALEVQCGRASSAAGWVMGGSGGGWRLPGHAGRGWSGEGERFGGGFSRGRE